MSSKATTHKVRLSHVESCNQYARDVISGNILACKWVIIAAKRHLEDLAKSVKEDYPYKFDEAKATKVCKFIEMMPHVAGKWAAQGLKITLEPWQQFLVCNIFGWLKKHNNNRRFSTAYVCVPRKNAKSTCLAAIGLYMLAMDGEFGAQVYSGATSEKQASFVFDPAKKMAEYSPEFRKKFGVEVTASSILQSKTNSKFERLIGKPKDGGGASLSIFDEFHSCTDSVLYDVMTTGMMAREQPLGFIITTAGSDTTGPCFPFQQDVQKMLEGSLPNDNLFGLIYTIDDDTDWTTEDALRMANPNWGVSVNIEKILESQRIAIQSPEKQNDFKTKHLDIWCTATSTWLNMERWNKLADAPPIEEFEGQPLVIGMDLAGHVDMAASVKLFQKDIKGTIHYYVYPKFYVPKERADLVKFRHYQKWIAEDKLIATPGSEIDFSYIKMDVLADVALYDVKALAFDRYQALDFKQQIQAETGIETAEIQQNVQQLSEPAKWLEGMITSGRIHHDGSEILAWNVGNAVVREDVKGNIFPHKDKHRPDNKIDGLSALLNCLSVVKAAMGLNNDGYYIYDGFGA